MKESRISKITTTIVVAVINLIMCVGIVCGVITREVPPTQPTTTIQATTKVTIKPAQITMTIITISNITTIMISKTNTINQVTTISTMAVAHPQTKTK